MPLNKYLSMPEADLPKLLDLVGSVLKKSICFSQIVGSGFQSSVNMIIR